jgi:hypothetical protein
MLRSIVLFLSAATFVALTVLAVLLHRSSPGPTRQEILGVTLGSGGGMVFISGRRLDCVRETDPPYKATCTIEIADKRLTIQAARGGPDRMWGGECQAEYAGQLWPCAIGSRHVHVHWFAHIRDPLGLDGAQMAALRRQYYFENLPEEPFLYGVLIAPVLAALAFGGGWLTWKRPSSWRDWLTAAGLSLLVCMSVFVLACQMVYNFYD